MIAFFRRSINVFKANQDFVLGTLSDTRHSPRQRLTVSEETAARAVVGQGRRPQNFRGAVVNRKRRSGAAHIRRHPAWARRRSRGYARHEFRRRECTQGVERSFRDLVSRRPGAHARQLASFRRAVEFRQDGRCNPVCRGQSGAGCPSHARLCP